MRFSEIGFFMTVRIIKWKDDTQSYWNLVHMFSMLKYIIWAICRKWLLFSPFLAQKKYKIGKKNETNIYFHSLYVKFSHVYITHSWDIYRSVLVPNHALPTD